MKLGRQTGSWAGYGVLLGARRLRKLVGGASTLPGEDTGRWTLTGRGVWTGLSVGWMGILAGVK